MNANSDDRCPTQAPTHSSNSFVEGERDSRLIPLSPSPAVPDASASGGTSDDALGEPFPLDALPEPLLAMVRETAATADVSPSLCAVNGLAVAAATLGSGLFVQSGPGLTCSGNLYVAAFVESGTGKGRAFRAMSQPYLDESIRRRREWDTSTAPDLRAALEMAKADLDRAKRSRRGGTGVGDAASSEIIKDAVSRRDRAESLLAAPPAINIGEATSEAVAVTLSQAPGQAGAILSGEGREFIEITLGKYSKSGRSSSESVYLQAYSGDHTVVRRMTRSEIVLSSPRLTLGLNLQPDVWQRLVAAERILTSGLLPRFIILNVKGWPPRPSNRQLDQTVVEAWKVSVVGLLRAFYDHPDPTRVIIPTTEAKAVLDDFANDAADAREPGQEWADIRPFAARLAENAWRVALVLHALKHGPDAPNYGLVEATAQNAIRLVRWFFVDTLELLQPVRGKRSRSLADRAARILLATTDRTMTLRNLAAKCYVRAAELLSALTSVPDLFEVEKLGGGPLGGRPSLIARLKGTH